jgi:CRP/FNR family transcriptional regulator, dissimilatory nitrate respiration regulator
MSLDFVVSFARKSGSRRTAYRGAFLFHRDDKVVSLFVVEYGEVELIRHQRDGTAIILQRAGPGSVLAEASIYSDRYHCDGVVALSASLWQIPKRIFLDHVESKPFARLWAAHLARETQAARLRCDILSRKTVAQRLDGWLEWNDNALPDKGQWKYLSRQIGVSPEALYREIARRRGT